MIPGLVSIITPCYNTGNLLPRLLDSILLQDYPFVEMFAIDDGSTDHTKLVISQYIDRFAQKGYTLNYVYQSNSGQSTAINNGLKLVHGEYLVWPDSDDWYSTFNALSRMVSVLSETDNSISMVRCLAEYVAEDTLETTRKIPFTEKVDLFEDCLFAKNGYWYCPGGYMCRISDLENSIIGEDIYTHKDAGQNWQIMLPLLYNRKCITINEYHYKILQRSTSHSRGQYKSYNQKIIILKAYETTIISTLERMAFLSDIQKEHYIRDIKVKYLFEQYILAFLNNKTKARALESQLFELYGISVPLRKKIRLFISQILRIFRKHT